MLLKSSGQGLSFQGILFSLIIFVFFITPLHAQQTTATGDQEPPIPPCVPQGEGNTERFLSCIQHYTKETLSRVNALPVYIKAWLTTKETDTSMVPAFQSKLTTLSDDFATIKDEQKNMAKQWVTDFFKDPADPMGQKALTQEQLRNANDLAYSTLLGMPYFEKDDRDTNPARNYIFNASGLNIQHVLPNPDWNPKDPMQSTRYTNYYNAVSAVQTYNAYVLGELFADSQKKFALSETQENLVEQATRGEWFTQVGSDNLGLVLRHILLFDSQIFVLLTRILEVQRQMLISQSMTNTLLVAVNLGNEDTLVKKANGSLNIP